MFYDKNESNKDFNRSRLASRQFFSHLFPRRLVLPTKLETRHARSNREDRALFIANIVFANVPNCSIRDRVGSLAISMEAFVASILRAFSPLFAVSVPAPMLFLSTRDRSLLSLLYCLRRPILFRPRRKPSCHTFFTTVTRYVS